MSEKEEDSTPRAEGSDLDEDRSAQSALGVFTPGWSTAEGSIDREFLELMGLLPYGLEPVEPSEATRAALLATVRGQVSSAARVVAFERPAPAADTSSPRLAPIDRVADRAASRLIPWLMPLAAALALVVIGLAGTLGWTMNQINEKESTLARLQSEMEEARLAKERLQLVTMKGTEVCRLEPMGDAPAQPLAHATFYMAPEKKGWVLSADNLEPCDQGNRYMVWFITDEGPVSGGTFFVKKAGKIEFSSDAMPEGTKAIMITLESEDQNEPTGPTILYGQEALMTL